MKRDNPGIRERFPQVVLAILLGLVLFALPAAFDDSLAMFALIGSVVGYGLLGPVLNLAVSKRRRPEASDASWEAVAVRLEREERVAELGDAIGGLSAASDESAGGLSTHQVEASRSTTASVTTRSSASSDLESH